MHISRIMISATVCINYRTFSLTPKVFKSYSDKHLVVGAANLMGQSLPYLAEPKER